MSELQKVENPIDLNFEELNAAGLSIDEINRALANQIGFNYQLYIDDGGRPEDFLYQQTTVAPKGVISAMTDAILRSITTTSAEVAAAIPAARTAYQVTPGPPAVKGIAGLVAGLGGGMAGGQVGDFAVSTMENIDLLRDEPVFPSDRPAARGAEIFTDALTTALLAPRLLTNQRVDLGAQLVLQKGEQLTGTKGKVVTGAGTVLNFAEGLPKAVKESMATKAGRFAEISGAGGSAVAGALAVESDDVSQLVAETAGGFFEPRRLAFTYIPRIISSGKKRMGIGIGDRELKVGVKFRELMEIYGEDPDALVKEIEENPARLEEIIRSINVDLDAGDIELTPAQITGSPIMAAFQKTFVGKGIKGEEAKRRAESAYQALNVMSLALIDSGDPTMVSLGLKIQQDAISDMFSGRMIELMANQTAAFERLGRQVDFNQVGLALRTNLNQIVDDGRNQETLLWEAVDRSVEIKPINLVNEFDRFVEEVFLDTESQPAFLVNYINKRKQRLGLIEPDPPKALVKAQAKVDGLSPLDINDFEKFRTDFLANPEEYLRIRGVSPEVREMILDTTGVNTNEAIELAADALSRRKGIGQSFLAELRNVKKVANARSELTRAQQTNLDPELDEFDTAKDVALFRSRMLTLAREAAGDPNRATEAKFYGELAQAALRDLDQGLDVGANKAYDAARAFSFGFNDSIKRTFIGEATGVTRFGADIITPELLIPKLFAGNTSAGALRMGQIMSGADFARRQMDELEAAELIPAGTPASGETGERLSKLSLDAQDLRSNLDDAVLYVASKVINRKTGLVDPDKVTEFLADDANARLMKIFPDIEDDMRDGARFVNAYKIAERRKADFDNKRNPVTKLLSQVAGTESVSAEILNISNGQNPIRGLQAITNRVNNPPKKLTEAMSDNNVSADDMKAGLKSAVIDAAWVNGGGTGGQVDYAQMGATLFDPLRRTRSGAGQAPQTTTTETGAPFQPPPAPKTRPPQNRSLMELMVEEGIFTQAESDRLKYIVEQGSKIQAAQKSGKLDQIITDDIGVFTEALLAIAGSTMTTTAVRSTGLRPQGIVEANFGARLFRNFFGDQSKKSQLTILERMALDPEYLVMLLKRSKTPEEVTEQLNNLNAYLIQAGLRFVDDDTSPTEDDAPPTELEQEIIRQNPGAFDPSRVSSATVPAAPSIPMPPAPVANVAAAQPRPSAQPSVRTRYQQVFPDDLASGIMSALPTRTS